MTIVWFHKSLREAFASTPASLKLPVIGHQKPDQVPQFVALALIGDTQKS